MYMRHSAKNSCESHIDIILWKLVSPGRISAQCAKFVKKEFQKFFIVIDQNKLLFSSLNPANDMVDTLFYETLGLSDECEDGQNWSKFF